MAAQYTPEQIAAAIRKIESGGNYRARSKSSSASGAYQYITSTWGGYKGYQYAWQAPREVQDEKALIDVAAKLARYGGDYQKAIMSWFLPAAVGNAARAAKVPQGNSISPNQYLAKVLRALGANPTKATGGNTADNTEAALPEPTPVPGERAEYFGTMEGQLANLLAVISVQADREF